MVIGLTVLILGAGCEPTNQGNADDRRGRPRAQSPAKPSSLLFLDGRALVRLEVASGRKTKLGAFPAPDVRASPGSPWIAYVVPGARTAESEPDFVADPHLRLLNADSGEGMSLGRGYSPLWDPSGSTLAFLGSSPARSCEGETCSGRVTVKLARPEDGQVETILEGGSYGLLGWAGDRVLIADASDTSHVLSVAPSGHRIRLPLSPSQFWGASPDGRWMITVGAEGTSLVRLRGGRLTSDTKPIALGGRLLAAGTWAADSSSVAAVALHPRAEPEIVLFSPEAPEVRTLSHSSGAGGAPLWSGNRRFLVFPRESSRGTGAFDAMHCPVGAARPQTLGRCRSLLTWREGVVLLRME